MAPHTRHYHCEDIAATRVHQHLIPGRGAIDFAATLREIARTGYHGWITVELYPYLENPEVAREAKSTWKASWFRRDATIYHHLGVMRLTRPSPLCQFCAAEDAGEVQ